MKILVIDGQGGGMGRAMIARVKALLPDTPLIALGTNALATAAMLRAGADAGATGENAIRCQCRDADVILGALGILMPNALMGEVTPVIAAAIAESPAQKLLIQSGRCRLTVVGAKPQSLDEATGEMAERLREMVAEGVGGERG